MFAVSPGTPHLSIGHCRVTPPDNLCESGNLRGSNDYVYRFFHSFTAHPSQDVMEQGLYHITRIHLSNIRGFRELDLSFTKEDKPRLRTLIIGKNGTCKTTLLRCIAVGLSEKEDGDALLADII